MTPSCTLTTPAVHVTLPRCECHNCTQARASQVADTVPVKQTTGPMDEFVMEGITRRQAAIHTECERCARIVIGCMNSWAPDGTLVLLLDEIIKKIRSGE